MAKKRVAKQPFYFGKKLTKVGKKKGFVKTSFIYIEEEAAKAMGVQLRLPKGIVNADYKVQDGIIIQSSNTAAGIVKNTPVSIKNGSKTVTVQLTTSQNKKIRSHGQTTDIVVSKSLSFGVPSWAALKDVNEFLKLAPSVKSFSIAGGRNRSVKRNGVK